MPQGTAGSGSTSRPRTSVLVTPPGSANAIVRLNISFLIVWMCTVWWKGVDIAYGSCRFGFGFRREPVLRRGA